MPQLASSHVGNAEYAQDTQELEITFQTGEVYTYFNVPPHVYFGLITTVDPGDYFRSLIRGVYSFERTE